MEVDDVNTLEGSTQTSDYSLWVDKIDSDFGFQTHAG